MDKQNFTIHETKNYNQFKFLDSNRKPNQNIINRLVKSIKANGLQIPIVLNPDGFIVDGQHRFWALQTLGYTIHYIVSKTWKNDSHTIEINNTGRRWTAMDFANYASANGNLDVEKAMQIAERWEKDTHKRLRPTTALEILMEGRTHAGLLTRLKRMTYKIDVERGMQVFDTLNEMSKHKMKASPFSARITRAIKIMNHDYDDLNEEIIEIMCTDNFVANYNKENDQLEYLTTIYDEAAIKYDRKLKNKPKKSFIKYFPEAIKQHRADSP